MTNLYLQRHEQFLEQIIQDAIIPAEQVRNAMLYALFPGGKRIRPVLVYLVGQLVDVPVMVLDVISSAIELTHCYSLIHDDLPAMDDDDLRRGRPSCHKAFDEATAILVGDGMQALAIEILLSHLPSLLPAEQVIHITKTLVRASGISGMVSGQSLDLSELAKSSISEERLKEIHHLKTGMLISACIDMVLAAQTSIPVGQLNALQKFGRHIGLVFQIQDDYLDCYAPADVLGKGRSSDAANHKSTFASLLSQEQLEHEIKRQYQIALDALKPFGTKASELIELTLQLQNRCNLT